MPVTKKAFLAYARRNKTIEKGVERAIDQIWPMLDATSMETLANDLAIYLPLLGEKFGKVAATAAAEFYDEMRAAERVKGSYKATTAKGKLWKVERDIAYATGDDFAYESVKDFLTASVQAAVKDYGRETIAHNTRSDEWADGYNSVPTSENPCVFCIMKALGSYRKYDGEFLDVEIDQDAWHDNCSCELIPVWKETPHWVEGQYDEYWDMYQAGRTQAASDKQERGESMAKGLSAAEVMAGMRKANGIEH